MWDFVSDVIYPPIKKDLYRERVVGIWIFTFLRKIYIVNDKIHITQYSYHYTL